MLTRKSLFRSFVAVAAAAMVCLTLSQMQAADHMDAPGVNPDGSLDLNDVYVFQSPQNPANVVLIMTVNPFAGARPQSSLAFNTRGTYEFVIDTNSDALPNFAYRFYFSAVRNGTQRYIITGLNGSVIASGETGKTTAIRSGGMVTCGLFDDPFFFDSAGFNNGLMFTGANFFAAANNTCIVLEVPSSTFGKKDIAIYGRTIVAGRQFDRVGRPAINTVLIGPTRKDAFNRAETSRDIANFGVEVNARLIALGSNAQQAAGLLAVLLPDLLTVDTSSPAGFLNGRRLQDDVIDAELALLTQGAITTDGAQSNDRPFLNVFPYLAAAQTLPTP